MFHPRFIWRQIMSSRQQTAVFIACVALSIVTLVSLGGFGDSVNASLMRDARELLAADVIVESGFPFTDDLTAEVDTLTAEDGVQAARVYEFLTIVRLTDGREDTLLTELKVVDDGYPFYGTAELQSGRPLAEVLVPGHLIVEQNLLDRLGVQVGDTLAVGDTTLTIADVLLFEPDRPVNFFSLGPRVLADTADLPAMGLIQVGSRVEYEILLQVDDEARVDAIAQQLEEAADRDQERIETFRTADTGVQSFFDNFLLFLSLIGIFTLMLAGIGIQSSLSSFLKEREQTIAIMRTFGADSQFVMRQFFAVAAILGGIGTLVGLGLGFLLQQFFPVLFARFLPPNVDLIISGRAIAEALVLGALVVVGFTFLPIYQVQELKPNFIFQKVALPFRKGWAYYVTLSTIAAFFISMVFYYLQDVEAGAYFVLGVLSLIALTAAVTYGSLWLLRHRRPKALAPRQALRGLFRPRNATAAVIITLTAALSVLFSIFLIEQNLNANFTEAFPEDAPNLFVLDIQADQRDDFRAAVDPYEAVLFPTVRARIIAVNGEPLPGRDDPPENAGPGGPGGGGDGEDDDRPGLRGLGRRTFNLTYDDALSENERLIAGDSLFADDEAGMAQVSVLSNFFRDDQSPFALGDIVTFRIQGVPLDARVTSIRSFAEEGGFRPSFSLILREQDLAAAPQTTFATVRVPDEAVAGLQNRLVAQFPNISVIDAGSAIQQVADIAADVTTIIRFFTLFSLVAGFLIIISSILATRFARIQEAVYFKVVGATNRFVLRVFALENVFLGAISAGLALLLSHVGSSLLITYFFELEYDPHFAASLLVAAGTIGLVTAVGLLASLSILQKKPIVFLREQTDE